MNCPKCQGQMETVTFSGIEVDRCTNCKGLWFDMLEPEKLKAMKGSEQIDTGDPDIGRQYNETDRIDCPVCRRPMIRMVDRRQPHIWFESCTQCYGVFFDAGEFTDYKQETLGDFFRDLTAKPRDI